MATSDRVQQGKSANLQQVKDVMNPDIMTVADDMTTDDLVRYLSEREISGAPVVDIRGHLVGVVSMTDIGRHLAEPPDFAELRPSSSADAGDEETLRDLGPRYLDERPATVRDVMTPAIHQVPATASVAEAARIMVERHIHRLIVTDGKEPVGIITSIDLLRVITAQR
jgi:CBS domain-containing protein